MQAPRDVSVAAPAAHAQGYLVALQLLLVSAVSVVTTLVRVENYTLGSPLALEVLPEVCFDNLLKVGCFLCLILS